MNKDGDTRIAFTIGMMVVALVSGGIWFARSPLESDRPNAEGSAPSSGRGDEIVTARLWEDPLAAIQAHWGQLISFYNDKQRLPARADLPPTITEIRAALAPRDEAPQLRLFVLAPGGPYVDDSEQRRRQRYAVVSALTGAFYVPAAEDRIGYFVAPSFSPRRSDDSACELGADKCPLDPHILIGYERYRYEENKTEKNLIVFWLNNEDFNASPLDQIGALSVALDPEIASARRTIETAVIGPVTSGDLRSWAEHDDRAALAFLRRANDYPTALAVFKPASRATPSEANGALAGVEVPAPAFEPDPRRLAALRVDQAALEARRVSDYLDEALTDGQQQVLAACIRGNGGQLRRCLEGPEFAGIVDSDHDWRDSVAGELELETRQVREIVDHVDDYLDDGLGEARTELTGCLTAGTDLRACLVGGELAGIEDSDEYWRDTVVGELYPTSLEGQVATVASYLDTGLSSSHRVGLLACLGRPGGRLRACLDSDEFDDIEDSDSDWRDSVAGESADGDTRVAETIGGISGDDWKVSFLLGVHQYLDHGLPLIPNGSELNRCLDGVPSAQGFAGKFGVLDGCLREHVKADDSDTDWASTVADSWLYANPQFTAQVDERDLVGAKRRGFRIFSARATAPADTLFASSTWNAPIPEGAQGRHGNARVQRELGVASFRSFIADDRAVMKLIINEIDARGGCDEGRIVILTERDSEYGRSLADSTQRLFDDAGCADETSVYGYLRGVDGEEAPRANAVPVAVGADTAPESQSGSPLPLSAAYEERTVGPEQLDYVRRLADKVGDEAESKASTVVAIGVLGSDVYDKQLILRALRERLPAPLYFTTDLDARLSEPDQYEWTRNLVVGSAYGLSLADSLIENAYVEKSDRRTSGVKEVLPGPPFRDVYQTAFFRAVREAVTTATLSDARDDPVPRLFEIGRSGPIDITPCSEDCVDPVHGTLGWLEHRGSRHERARDIAIVLLPLLLLTLAARARAAQLPQGQATLRRGYSIAAYLGFASALLMGVLLWFWNAPQSEPWLLLEGVSAAPTMILHATVVVAAAGILVIGHYAFHQSTRDVRLTSKSGEFALGSWSRFLDSISINRWNRELAEIDDAKHEQHAQEIWDRYCALGRWRQRLVRYAIPAVFWSGAIYWVTNLGANPLVERGAYSDWVRFAAIAAVMCTVFWCNDALRLGGALLRAMATRNVIGLNGKPTEAKGDADAAVDKYTTDRQATMAFVVRITELLSPIVVLPFLLLFIAAVARSSIFDGWVWTGTLFLIYGGFSAYVLLRALQFQIEAARTRDRVVADLQRCLQTASEPKRWRISKVIDEIGAIHSGAFAPWTRHPILQSLAIPSGGFGLLTVLGQFF